MRAKTKCYQKRHIKFTIRQLIKHESLASIEVIKKTHHEEEIKETISKPKKTVQLYEEMWWCELVLTSHMIISVDKEVDQPQSLGRTTIAVLYCPEVNLGSVCQSAKNICTRWDNISLPIDWW